MKNRYRLLHHMSMGATIGLLVAAMVCFLVPKMYESEAIIEIKQFFFEYDFNERRPEGVSPEAYIPPWLMREIARMKSDDCLNAVIDHLGLEGHWKMERRTALQKLNEIVSTRSIRGSDLISIRVRHHNKVDARDIAMEVANDYLKYREKIGRLDRDRQLLELNKAIKDQEELVEKSRKLINTILVPSTESPTHDTDRIQMAGGLDCIEAKRELESDQELLQALRSKLVQEGFISTLHHNGAEIRKRPVIADSPVSPDLTLNLTIGFLLGMILSPLLTLPLIRYVKRHRT